MRFAARENSVIGQIEVGFGTTPGAGGVQHLARLLGRGRAMEAILGADDFDAEQAERYGWINRALPDAGLDAFVARLPRRIASFPADPVRTAKRVLNELTLPGADAIRADARRFRQLVAWDPAQGPTAALFAQGLQTHSPSNSTSATASEPCDRETDPTHRLWQHRRVGRTRDSARGARELEGRTESEGVPHANDNDPASPLPDSRRSPDPVRRQR
jgi:hypothetical protein